VHFKALAAELETRGARAEVRERIVEFKEREAELREILIAATEAKRVGEEWIAHVSEQHKKLLDREALTEHFGAEALQPFMRESVATVLKLKDAHTGRQRRRRCDFARLHLA
jgi:hypothetical protein